MDSSSRRSDFGLLRDAEEGLAAVADLHHRGANAVPVEQLLANLLEHLDRQRRWTGAEIEDAAHVRPSSDVAAQCNSPVGRPVITGGSRLVTPRHIGS